MSGTGDLCVKNVEIDKSKKTKLANYTPSDPIKTTHHLNATNIRETSCKQRRHSKNFSQQRKHPVSSEQIRELGVTAILAEMTSARSDRRSSKKASVKKLSEYYLTVALMETYCSTKREQPNNSPT